MQIRRRFSSGSNLGTVLFELSYTLLFPSSIVPHFVPELEKANDALDGTYHRWTRLGDSEKVAAFPFGPGVPGCASPPRVVRTPARPGRCGNRRRCSPQTSLRRQSPRTCSALLFGRWRKVEGSLPWFPWRKPPGATSHYEPARQRCVSASSAQAEDAVPTSRSAAAARCRPRLCAGGLSAGGSTCVETRNTASSFSAEAEPTFMRSKRNLATRMKDGEWSLYSSTVDGR